MKIIQPIKTILTLLILKQTRNKIAKNVPKRKTVRKDFRPKGPPRHDPTSAEWQSVLIEQQQKNQKSAKKRKPADSTIEEGGQAKKKKSAQKKNSNSE